MKKLQIAFDCQGTLTGTNSVNVLKLFNWCKNQGHTIIVWSSSLTTAYNTVDRLKVKDSVIVDKKRELNPAFNFREPDPDWVVDIAIDDDLPRDLDWMATKKIIHVSQITDDESTYQTLIGE